MPPLSSSPYPPRPHYTVPLSSGRVLALGERCLVMGVLNVTPDSFAEGVRLDAGSVLSAALRMEDEGADLLDLGGESTRPGAGDVGLDEEMARVVPAIRALTGRVRIPISVDTRKSEVARAALAEGAAFVNDVSALQDDPSMGRVVADTGCAVVLMHSRGRSAEMYALASYEDLIAEVTGELQVAMARAEAAGVPAERVILDPGIGFAKRPVHSYGVLAGVPEIASRLGRPLLVGPSRKSFMAAALGDRPATDRDWGTAAAVTASVLAGAHIVRVHAVGPMAQVVRVAEQIRAAAG